MKSLFLLIGKLLSVLNIFIPKKQKRIVFYSNLGFRDNVEALYDYTINNVDLEEYKVIVASNDYKTLKHINGVKYVNCYVGVLYFLTSKYFFYSFGKYPIVPSKKQIVINLWHGMPLKKIGNMESGKERNKYDYFSFVISTSSFFDSIMMKSFNCDNNRILRVGQPRTDVFFQSSNDNPFHNYDKVIIWMPTFRVTDILGERNSSFDYPLPIIYDEKQYYALNNYLKRNNYCLLIKFHPIQSTNESFVVNTDHIQIINEEYLRSNNIKLYSLLKNTDMLITDYSSVFFDYLLLNKPMIFTEDDVDDYKSQRGFVVDDPKSIQPGYHVSSYDELIIAMESLRKNNDLHKEERASINNYLNEYSTHNNCKEILSFCGINED